MTYSVSTVGSLQSIPSTQFLDFTSTQFLDFTALLDKGVQERMTHLNEKYERCSTDYEELLHMVMNIRSHLDGVYAPPLLALWS